MDLREEKEFLHGYPFSVLENMGESNLRPPFSLESGIQFYFAFPLARCKNGGLLDICVFFSQIWFQAMKRCCYSDF